MTAHYRSTSFTSHSSLVLNLTITSEGILTCVFRETDAQGGFLDLFSEQVFLVEEENDGSVNEEFVVTDGIEQHKRLVHAILQEEKKPEWRIDREKEAETRKKKFSGDIYTVRVKISN